MTPRPTLLLLALATLISTPAFAGKEDDARRYFNRGLELVESGAYEAGIEQFELAYQAVPHPVVLYNIARAYTDAGEYEAAIRYFELYLASDPPDVAEVNQLVDALEARMASSAPAVRSSSHDRMTLPRRHTSAMSARSRSY